MDNLKSKSIKAFFWDFIGKIANQGIAFLTSIILARILAPEEFGLIALINVIFSFANIFMDVGLAASLIQRKRLLPIHFSSVFYFNISVGLLLTIITFFSAPLVAAFYNIPILEILTQVMSISFIISSFGIVQNIQLKKVLNFKKITSLQLLAVIISGIVGVAMAYTGYGVWSLLTQILLNRFLYTALVWIVVKWTPGFNFSLKALKQLWGFGFRIFISDIFGVLYNQMDVIIVGKLFPINSLGYLQRAKSLNTTIFQLASSSLTQVLFPVLSSVQNEIEKFKSIVTRSLYVISFATLFISGILYLCADDLIIILFTKKWLSSIEYFKIIVLGGFLYPINVLLINIISSQGNSKRYLTMNLIKKIPQTFVFIFGFMFGINGFLYGLLIGGVINTLIGFYYASKEINTTVYWFLKPILPHLVLSSFLIVLIYYFTTYLSFNNHYYSILLKGAIFTISYLLIAYILKFKSLNLILNIFKP